MPNFKPHSTQCFSNPLWPHLPHPISPDLRVGSREGGGSAGWGRGERSGRVWKVALQEIWQPYIGDESSPGQWLQTDPHRRSGLKMSENKEEGRGTGFPKGMPIHPTGSEKRMLNEPMISVDHTDFFRRTAKDSRIAETPLGTNRLTEKNISKMVRILKDILCFASFSADWLAMCLSICLSGRLSMFFIELDLSCV